MFEKYKVLSRSRDESRMDIYLEQYIKTINVEAKLTIEISKTMIFPAAIRYQGELAVTCANLKTGRLHVRHRHARQGDGFGQGIAG